MVDETSHPQEPASLPAIPPGCRIVVIEGIPGAGKTTLCRRLAAGIDGRRVAAFDESALLHDWKHTYLPGIHERRLQLYQRMLDQVEAQAMDERAPLHVFTRFHLSYVLLGGDAAHPAYARVLARLAQAGALVLVPVVEDAAIEARAAHVERTEPGWVPYLQRRMAETGCRDLHALYGGYQRRLLELLRTQALAYRLLPPIG